MPPDCKLKKLLKAHGWERSHFVKDVDLSQLRQELGNIYLSKCVSSKDHDTSANIISMFCPDLLSVLLSEHKVSDINKLQPCSRAFHGACMLVDISGFTNLAASLCRVVASGATYSRSSRTFSTSQKSQTIRDYLRHMSGMNGSNGLDQLRSTTNVFLGNLVQTVYAHGTTQY